ncbi:MAG: response regulator [Sediminibacterium sp.]
MRLALVDDHILFRKSLAACIDLWVEYRVMLQAGSGSELRSLLQQTPLPELILLDIRMPGMNGFEIIEWIQHQYPDIKLLVISMLEEDHCLEKLLNMGVHGYLQKDAEPNELKNALDQIRLKGQYLHSTSCLHLLQERNKMKHRQTSEAMLAAMLSDRERIFLQWLCTDKSYKEIAAEMFVSPRTIDGYRDNLLKKINVASRVGLVTFAIRQGIVVL